MGQALAVRLVVAKNKDKLHIALKKDNPIRVFKSAVSMDYIEHLLESYYYYQYFGVFHTVSIIRIEIMESELVLGLINK